MRRNAAAIAIAVGLSFAASGACGATVDGAAAAERFVAALAGDIVDVYREDLSPEAARAQFTEIFERAVDTGGMAAAVLGSRWPAATPAEQTRFVELLRERAVTALEARLGGSDDGELCVTGSDVLGDARFFVRGHVCEGANEQRRLGWLVVGQGEELRVGDFIVEGTSFVATVRAEYASVLARGGGSVTTLIQEMEKARTR